MLIESDPGVAPPDTRGRMECRCLERVESPPAAAVAVILFRLGVAPNPRGRVAGAGFFLSCECEIH